MAKVNLKLPRIDTEALSDSQAIQRITSYLYQLNEQLRYELTHIDEDNMTGNTGAAGISNAAIRSVVQKELENQVIDITNNVTILEIMRKLDSIDLNIGNVKRIQRSDEDTIAQIQRTLNTKASQATVTTLSESLTALSGTVSTLSTTFSGHSHSMSVSGGTVTIGGPVQGSSSFNIADTQFYKDAVRSAKREGIQSVKILAGDIILDPSGTLTYYSASKQYSVPVYAEATNGESNTNGIMIDASEAWNAGKNSVTLSDTGWTQNATRTITASNGQTVIVSVPNVSVSGGSWSSGKKMVYAYYGNSGILGSLEVELPSSATWAITYNAGGETVTCTIGGKTYTHTFNS